MSSAAVSMCPPNTPHSAGSLSRLTASARHRNMLRPSDMFVRGFGDEHYHVLREEHLARGKGYSIGIPPGPEPGAEFLPSDKSRQLSHRDAVREEGRGERGAGGLTQSCLRGMEHFERPRPSRWFPLPEGCDKTCRAFHVVYMVGFGSLWNNKYPPFPKVLRVCILYQVCFLQWLLYFLQLSELLSIVN